MITIIHYKGGYKAAYKQGRMVLGTGYFTGRQAPNFPVPAIPCDVLFMSFAIAVCEMNNPEYKHGVITLYPQT